MSHNELEVRIGDIFDEIEELMLERHKKYGAGNIAEFGLQGIIVRLSDKMARLKHGLENYGDESLEDTLRDVIGYGVIALLWEREQWPGQEPMPRLNKAARERAEELKAQLHEPGQEKPLADWELDLLNAGSTAKQVDNDQKRSDWEPYCPGCDTYITYEVAPPQPCGHGHWYCPKCGRLSGGGSCGRATLAPDFKEPGT